MEKKLAEYRAKKAKEHPSSSDGWFSLNPFRRRNEKSQPQTNENEIDASKDIGDEIKDKNQTGADLPYREPWNRTQLTLTLLMWIFAWLFCIENQFGAVFFVVSMIFFIYYNTRTGTGRKDGNKLSAYSVFNPNCERIDGTFTSEQFEKELLHGANSVRS